jgi:addiction module RelE/StbE family toxin
MRLLWTRRAERRLDEILSYIAQDNPRAARDTLTAIRAKAGYLLSNPELGHVGRVHGTRELIVSRSYIVVYRIRPRKETIEILTVRHAARRWPPKQ